MKGTSSDLCEKDLYCIARHIQTLVKQHWHKESIPKKDCELCTYAKTCGFDPWGAFVKLSELTGVNISALKGFKV